MVQARDEALAGRPPDARDLPTLAVAAIQRLLPRTWSASFDESRSTVDAVAPGGARVSFALVTPRSLRLVDVSPLLIELSIDHPGVAPLVVARYLSPPLRERLAREGASYVDMTGNVLVSADSPAMHLREVGLDRDPWRGPGRPRQSLSGRPAALVVRALADFGGSLSLPGLARVSGASTGAVYRIVEYLEAEGLVERDAGGALTRVDWRALIERWALEYSLLETNDYVRAIGPRGVEQVLANMRGAPLTGWALTGAAAVRDVVTVAPTRLITAYVSDPVEALRAWQLTETEQGANVLLIRPAYDVILDRTRVVDGVRCVALSQAATDLLGSPGRGPAEGSALLDWMDAHETAWRS